MSDDNDTLSLKVSADTSAFRRELADCDKLASGFGKAITGAFTNAALTGKDFGDVLSGLALKLSDMALKAAFKPVSDMIGGGMNSLFEGATSGLTGLFSSLGKGLSGVTPFAQGGIVAAPSYFPMPDGGTGLMGERGSEAVMPLSRMNDGRLGIVSTPGGAGASIIMNVSTPDASGFLRSESEITAMLARAVGRGQRSL